MQTLVDRRLRAKLDRQFEAADALLDELGERGVAVSDDSRGKADVADGGHKWRSQVAVTSGRHTCAVKSGGHRSGGHK